jgi:hypothetical protein
MIATETYQVNLTRTFQKVLYLSTALHGTFVFLAVESVGRNALYHCDNKGRVMFRHQFEHSVDSFTMPSRSEVVILYPSDNLIYHFDLQRQRVEHYSH